MNFTYQRAEGTPERYSVMADESGGGHVMGTLTRVSETQWHLEPRLHEQPAGILGVTVRIEGADFADVQRVCSGRMEAVLLGGMPRTVLTNDVAEGLTWGILQSVNAICSVGDALPGYANGLARALAQVVVEDIPEDREAEFRAKFGAQVDQRVAADRQQQKFTATMHTQLEEIFKAVARVVAPVEDPTTKH